MRAQVKTDVKNILASLEQFADSSSTLDVASTMMDYVGRPIASRQELAEQELTQQIDALRNALAMGPRVDPPLDTGASMQSALQHMSENLDDAMNRYVTTVGPTASSSPRHLAPSSAVDVQNNSIASRRGLSVAAVGDTDEYDYGSTRLAPADYPLSQNPQQQLTTAAAAAAMMMSPHQQQLPQHQLAPYSAYVDAIGRGRFSTALEPTPGSTFDPQHVQQSFPESGLPYRYRHPTYNHHSTTVGQPLERFEIGGPPIVGMHAMNNASVMSGGIGGIVPLRPLPPRDGGFGRSNYDPGASPYSSATVRQQQQPGSRLNRPLSKTRTMTGVGAGTGVSGVVDFSNTAKKWRARPTSGASASRRRGGGSDGSGSGGGSLPSSSSARVQRSIDASRTKIESTLVDAQQRRLEIERRLRN